MKVDKCIKIFPVVIAAALTGGCASVSTVTTEGKSDSTLIRSPVTIWIRPFATDGGMWLKDSAEPENRAQIRDWLSGCLIRRLSTIAPAHLLESEVPTEGWLVTGRFLRVNPGSKSGRMFFGAFGGGASEMETQVDVYDLAVSEAEPVLTFTTTGGSNLATGLHGVMNATDDDVDRTAREIREHLEARLWADNDEHGGQASPEATGKAQMAPAPR
jgi:hypothetical protein